MSNVLRKLKKRDASRMIGWMHDPKVNCSFRFDFSGMTEKKVFEFIASSFTEENQHFAFVDHKDEYLGTISLKNISVHDKNAEYAIVCIADAQGTGIAYRATMHILDYAFNTLKLHRVYLNVLEENERANAFYKKCGFTYEGQFKEHLIIRGEYKNLNWYGMTEKQFSTMSFFD